MHRSLILAAAVLALGAAPVHAQNFTATLTGADEVPANDSPGKGELKATLDPASKVLTYTATYSGLMAPATMAHFHGPAAPGANAPPVVPVPSAASPIKGTATLTDGQIADLKAGRWYFNVHSSAHPPGEIRGQVMAAP